MAPRPRHHYQPTCIASETMETSLSDVGMWKPHLRGGTAPGADEDGRDPLSGAIATHDDSNSNEPTQVQKEYTDPRHDSAVDFEIDTNLLPAAPSPPCEAQIKPITGLENISYTMPEPVDILPRF